MTHLKYTSLSVSRARKRNSGIFVIHNRDVVVYFEDDEPDVKGFRTVMVAEPNHPYAGAWWPPGYILGYEHTFVRIMKDLLDGIAAGKGPAPTFENGYRCQAVLDAVERSTDSREWIRPEYGGP